MPVRTYIVEKEKTAPGFKAFKNCLTLLLGAAEGTAQTEDSAHLPLQEPQNY